MFCWNEFFNPPSPPATPHSSLSQKLKKRNKNTFLPYGYWHADHLSLVWASLEISEVSASTLSPWRWMKFHLWSSQLWKIALNMKKENSTAAVCLRAANVLLWMMHRLYFEQFWLEPFCAKSLQKQPVPFTASRLSTRTLWDLWSILSNARNNKNWIIRISQTDRSNPLHLPQDGIFLCHFAGYYGLQNKL